MESQRIKRSKTMLKTALIELLKGKPIKKITVYELCKTAQINRTTFYKYYGSQYDLLEEIENDFFSDLQTYLMSDDAFELNALQHVMEYLDAEREKCRLLMYFAPEKVFIEKLFGLPVISTLLGKHIDGSYSPEDKRYVHVFICHGGYAIIRQWLDQDERESPAEIAARMYELCLGLLGA